MIEIGETLREARRRRGLRLKDVEGATRISTRCLRALEENRFEALHAPFYVRSCLREYSAFLGLDGDRLVEEYRERFPEAERPLVLERIEPDRRAQVSRLIVGVLVAAAAATGLIVLVFRPTGEAGPLPAPAAARPSQPTSSAAPSAPSPEQTPNPAVPRIVLAAPRGDCWLLVRAGSQDGRILYEGVLGRGDTIRFRKRRLWVRLGAPWNVEIRVDGRALGGEPVGGSEPSNVLISRAGIRGG